MALLEEWILTDRVDAALCARVARIVSELLPKVEQTVVFDDGFLHVDVMIPRDALDDLATRLDEPLDHFSGWSWREEIDDLEEGEVYAIRVEMVEKVPETFESDERELSVLSVYSKDRDNLAAWPVAFVLAARLAHELGAQTPED